VTCDRLSEKVIVSVLSIEILPMVCYLQGFLSEVARSVLRLSFDPGHRSIVFCIFGNGKPFFLFFLFLKRYVGTSLPGRRE
jgi:hypothetical protein